MSTVSGVVTPGYTVPAAPTGITVERLNLIANPVVTVDLTNAVAAADLQTGAVTGGTTGKVAQGTLALWNMATDVLAQMRTAALTMLDDQDGSGKMTIQVKDANGTNLADRFLLRVWVSASQFSAPAAITTFAPLTGTTILTHTANAALSVLTDANGEIVMDVNPGGPATRYVMAEINGKVYAGRIIITAV